MTLASALDDLVTLIEGTAPPTDVFPTGFYSPPYRHAKGRIDPEGAETEDRTFWFDGFTRQPQLETAATCTRVEYEVPLALMLRNGDLGLLDQIKRSAEEARTIARAIEATESWSSGVHAVITGSAEVVPAGDNETDILLIVQLLVTISEE